MLRFSPDVHDFKGMKVTVMGLGLFGGGVGVTKFLCSKGARVTVTDLKDERTLASSIAELKGLDLALRLGSHSNEDFTGADLLVVNPAIPPGSPFVKLAVDAGVPLESELNLFFKICPARKVGVTGSNGKTTTSSLIYDVIRAGISAGDMEGDVWLGGNIGRSLLDSASSMSERDVVVLEISSFQLENLGSIAKSPDLSVVTNIHPNHLDRHLTMENYIDAKFNIVSHQRSFDHAVLNADDPVLSSWGRRLPGRPFWFSRRAAVEQGAWLEDSVISFSDGKASKVIGDVSGAKLPGVFNRENFLAAAAACGILGMRPSVIRDSILAFPGVEHRLEFVGLFSGVKVYNDSIGTDPSAATAALEALPGRIILVAGGRDKKLPFDGFLRAASGKLKAAVLVGEMAEPIKAMLSASCPDVTVRLHGRSFDNAVADAVESAVPGDIILLSPACTSFDMFNNFVERGLEFKRLIRKHFGQ